MTENRSLYDWAKIYKKVGWNVIPLFDYTKSPSRVDCWDNDFGWMPGWKPLEKRMSTEKEFEHWFREKTPTGIAVITGKISDIVVVDEDSYKKDGIAFNHESPLKVKTARGGTHHFFKYSENINTTGYKTGINIEIKSEGGIIVLPPSKVWIDGEKKTLGEYQWSSRCPLSKLPTITGEHVKKIQKAGPENGKIVGDIHEYLNAEIGFQHNNLRTISLSILNRFPVSEWDIASEIVRDMASKFKPPHPKDRTEKMIKDAMKFIMDNPKDIVHKELEKEKGTFKKDLKPKTLREVASERLLEMDLEKDAPTTGYLGLDLLIRGFIPGHLYTLTGDTNIGKTSAACNFSEKLREQKKNVLYFALEPENSVVDYLASVRANKPFRELTKEDIMFDDEYISVFGKQEVSNVDDLITIIRSSEKRYDFIIIDHIGYFIKDKSNTNQDQSNVIKQLAGLAKEKRVAIMMIAHLRKKQINSKKDLIPTADDISGSGSFKQDSTEVLILTRKKESKDPNDFKLSNEGAIWVAKTKCGPNGMVPIYFSDNRAKIFGEEELWKNETIDYNTKLNMMGFKDKDPIDNGE